MEQKGKAKDDKDSDSAQDLRTNYFNYENHEEQNDKSSSTPIESLLQYTNKRRKIERLDSESHKEQEKPQFEYKRKKPNSYYRQNSEKAQEFESESGKRHKSKIKADHALIQNEEQHQPGPSTSATALYEHSKKRKVEGSDSHSQNHEYAVQYTHKRKIPETYKQPFVKAQEPESDEEISRSAARVKPKLLAAKGIEEWDIRAKELMLKTGFAPGQGLGPNKTGIEAPVDPGRINDGRGLGFQKKYDQEIIEEAFEDEKTEEKEVKWIPKDTLRSLHTILSGMVEGERKEYIEDEIHFCDQAVLKEVLRLKTLLDDMKSKELMMARSRSNPYETIKKGIFINRAAMKMANIDSVLDFQITKFETDREELLYFADVCAGPGGFTEYVLYRKKWLAKGFGFTLKGDCDFKLGSFKVASTETFETIYGPDRNSDGDIYNPVNVNYFINHVLQSTEGIGVHFMMADGGFSVEGQENIQEILSHQIYLSQCLVALSIVRAGGHFICKLFDVFTPFSVGLIYLFNLCFHKVAVHKPVTSRPANSERYLYCMHKCSNGTVDAILGYLQTCHQKMWEFGSSAHGKQTKQTIIQLMDLHILTDETTKFFRYIYHSNNEFGRDQIEGLKKIIAFHKNQNLKETRQWETKIKFMDSWKISMIPANEGDLLPQYLIAELIKSEDTHLTTENMKPVVKSPYFWICTPIECPESKYYRTFYKSNGRSSMSMYEGGYRNRWTSISDISISFEMPKNTLVYGEIVYGKRNRAAFYIIDGYMLGGRNIQNENFEQRLQLCEKFAKAVNKKENYMGKSLASVKVKPFVKLGKEYFPDLIARLEYIEDSKNQDVYCPLDFTNESPLYQSSGLLFLKTTQEPWIKHWSRSQNKEYYYNTLSKESIFNPPRDADANFDYTISNRLIWYWSKKLLNEYNGNGSNHLHYHSLLEYLKSL